MFAAAAACLAADEEGGGAAAAGGQPAMHTDPSADFWGCTKSIPDPLSHVPFRSGCPSGRRGAARAAGDAGGALPWAACALASRGPKKTNVAAVAASVMDGSFITAPRPTSLPPPA